MKNPPYYQTLVIPIFPMLYIFVGEPGCWDHARQQQEQGFNHFLCLPVADNVTDYYWPIAGCYVAVIVLTTLDALEEARLLSALCHFQPLDISLRHWPLPGVITLKRKVLS